MRDVNSSVCCTTHGGTDLEAMVTALTLMTTRRWLCAMLGGLLVVGCGTPPPDVASAQNEYLVRSLMTALQDADTAVIEDLFWPDATYEDYASQVEYHGIDEIVSYVTSAHTWGDDVYLNVAAVHASPDAAVAEWLFAAVQNRPMGDFVPVVTGREVQLNGVTIIEVESGRIRRAADYTDTAPLALQLGGRIELPGGRVLELEDGN